MPSSDKLTAAQVIKALNLTPHPEKGFYIETFRDTHGIPTPTAIPPTPTTTTTTSEDESSSNTTATTPTTATTTTTKPDRPASTCIYYLLEGESGLSHWHRVLDAVEVWHHYAGAPLQLSLSWDDGKPVRDVILGKDLLHGERPQAVVQRGEWQHARSLGDWTLVGCSVAPAFVFESFEMAPEGWEPRGAVREGEKEKK